MTTPYDPQFSPPPETPTPTPKRVFVDPFAFERKCLICGTAFTSKVVNARYCSPACRRKQFRALEREKRSGTVPTAEQKQMSGWIANPTEDVLRATEALLLARKEGGQTFCGIVPHFVPTAEEILWGEGEGGVWNMIYFK